MTSRDRLRVLLVWPGGLFSQGKNFGVPQLLSIAAAIRDDVVDVDIADFDIERAFGPIDLRRLLSPGYNLIGLSCYSSYEYLKVVAIGRRLRELAPKACLVTGGYHPSARPNDFDSPDSPFDHVIVGDGEGPMRRLVQALKRGRPPSERALPVEPSGNLDDLPPIDWMLLDRYRPVARRVASQAEIYLSRGCPFACTFCMERAKRCTKWRAFAPERAVEELHRLDRFLDLSRWTLFVTDALFGLKRSWRRSFLELLAKRPIRARKIWLLARADLLEREDLAMMKRANVAPGFGLESGSPRQLARIQKAKSAEAFLDHMLEIAHWARELDLPFGANVIAGHPGETEQTLRESAHYLNRLFLGQPSTTGFLSVDPFRLYPGSDIDDNLDQWVAETGMRAHRYPWWNDGDQDFLSEWVDPSGELDFRTAQRLRIELFGPILRGIQQRFSVDDPESAYFRRSIDEQVALLAPRRHLRTIGLWHLWRELTEVVSNDETDTHIVQDDELADVARKARGEMIRSTGMRGSDRVLEAIELVPRERFVQLEDIAQSSEDRALALLGSGGSTISAPHAYAASFGALALGEGDDIVDLGGGSGYGAALASHVVGPTGSVRTFEIDARLVLLAKRNLSLLDNVDVVHADAHEVRRWEGATKVTVGFALPAIPGKWIEALGEGGKLVAPVGPPEAQVLTLVEKGPDGVRQTRLGRVRYVSDRGKGQQSAS